MPNEVEQAALSTEVPFLSVAVSTVIVLHVSREASTLLTLMASAWLRA